jgi:hypothetical protein
MRPLDAPTCSPDVAFDRFFAERCVTRVSGRVSCRDLRAEFIAWMRIYVDPGYDRLSAGDRRDLKTRMHTSCLYAVMSIGGRTRGGYYGVSLRGHGTELCGTKRKDGNRHAVDELDAKTGAVLGRFASQTEAARDLGVSLSVLSIAISGERMIRGRLFRKQKA